MAFVSGLCVGAALVILWIRIEIHGRRWWRP